MDEISNLVRQISVHAGPGDAYFDSFLSRYKMHRQAKIRRKNFMVAAALILFACACLVGINNHSNKLDIDTASGNMSTHHNKTVLFEGDVVMVTEFIKKHVKEKTETTNLRDYFNGEDVWGVYVPGDEKFRYYYQCMGKGRYSVFIVND